MSKPVAPGPDSGPRRVGQTTRPEAPHILEPPGRPPKQTPKGRETQRRLIEAAQHLIQSGGSVEIAEVAAMAGVTQSVLYRYFGSKSGMVEQVLNRFYDDYDTAAFLAPVEMGATWVEREAHRIEREIAFMYEHPLGKSVAAGLLEEPAATRVDAQRQRAHAAMAARNIRHAQRTGELASTIDADLAGAAIIGALRGTLAEALSRTAPPPQAQVAATIHALSIPLLALLPIQTKP